MLELGAGTGLLSILCRKILDLRNAADLATEKATATAASGPARSQRDDLVLATDFLPSVLDNLKICVDLNFPAAIVLGSGTETGTSIGMGYNDGGNDKHYSHNGNRVGGVHIAKLDWTTFPAFAERRFNHSSGESRGRDEGDESNRDGSVSGSGSGSGDQYTAMGQVQVEEQMELYIDRPFDLVLTSDCVYDPTHAAMIREVVRWVLRLPGEKEGDEGGTMVSFWIE